MPHNLADSSKTVLGGPSGTPFLTANTGRKDRLPSRPCLSLAEDGNRLISFDPQRQRFPPIRPDALTNQSSVKLIKRRTNQAPNQSIARLINQQTNQANQSNASQPVHRSVDRVKSTKTLTVAYRQLLTASYSFLQTTLLPYEPSRQTFSADAFLWQWTSTRTSTWRRLSTSRLYLRSSRRVPHGYIERYSRSSTYFSHSSSLSACAFCSGEWVTVEREREREREKQNSLERLELGVTRWNTAGTQQHRRRSSGPTSRMKHATGADHPALGSTVRRAVRSRLILRRSPSTTAFTRWNRTRRAVLARCVHISIRKSATAVEEAVTSITLLHPTPTARAPVHRVVVHLAYFLALLSEAILNN